MKKIFTVLFLLSSFAFGQDAIINEMSQGSSGNKEWVEILVTTHNLDMRGWELGDNDDGNWHPIVEFTQNNAWSSVAEGTLIVIYNSDDIDGPITAAGAPDTDFSDKVVLIPVDNSTYVDDIGGWPGLGVFGNSDRDDCAAIRDASDVIVHDMAVTHNTATVTSPTSGNVKSFTEDSVGEVILDANWVQTSSSSGTPGAPNGGNNTIWINTILPVELTTFSASVVDKNITLNWETATEVNNYGFNVERKTEAGDWSKLGFINGHGNSNSPKSYSFVDNTVHNAGKYLYRLKQVDIDGSFEYSSMVEVDFTAQLEYKLNQNFPNPFNPTTSIQFSLPEASQVKLVVFNVIGEQVAELVNKNMEAGNHNVEFNASELNSGIYIYKIEANGFAQIRKMMLVK